MKFIALALVATSSVVLMADGKSATISAPVHVQIISPITLESNGIMQFGKVVVDKLQDPVVITLTPVNGDVFTATKVITNGSDLGSSQAPSVPCFHARYDQTVGWAGLTVTADPSVTLAPGVTLVPDLATGLGGLRNCVIFPLSPGQEAKHFTMGGTLTADAGVLGDYTGKVSITVAYN